MNKFAFKLMVVLVFASLVLSACGGGAPATEAPAATEAAATEAPAATEAAATEAPAASAGEGEVAIVAWPGYIERGANDAAYDWVTGFEAETGVEAGGGSLAVGVDH